MARWFIIIGAIILVFTGTAKIVSSFGTAKLLQSPDPVFALSFKKVFIVVGSIEIVVAFTCLITKNITMRLALLAWLASLFAFYRIGVWMTGYNRPCSCLGNLTDALHIRPEIASTAMMFVLLYLIGGSYGFLLSGLLRTAPRR